MERENLISAEQFCEGHHIEISFISLLMDHELIETVMIENTSFIHADQLAALERIAYLHYELEINLEGIETIMHLLRQVDDMKNEMRMLENKLHFYEKQMTATDVL